MDKQVLLNSKHFCMIPFIHSCVWTDGRVIPCCINQEYVLGNAKTQQLSEIYNNDNQKLKTLRQEMINGPALPESCNRCGTPEETFGANTYRTYANQKYGKFFDELQFDENNNLTKPNIRFWDVRFSNICNLKCRTCDPINSSKIAEEERRSRSHINVPVLKEAFDDVSDFFNFFVQHIDGIEEIYFCGGEPLMLAEHYKMLDLLIEHKKFNTLLRYNSNCTVLNFKGKNVTTDYWPLFKRVDFCASLDAGWEQFEYIRHGGIWREVVDNLKNIKKNSPHVRIEFSPTVSILNVNSIERLHKFLLEEHLISIDSVYYNILTWPPEFSLTVLPPINKQQVKDDYIKYANYLQGLNANNHTIEKLQEVVAYMYTADNQSLLPIAKSNLVAKDKIRKQNYSLALPELKGILE